MAPAEVSEIVKKVREIEIKTKYFVESLFQSAYVSVFKGRGLEFSEVREYQYGDEMRIIDWTVSARMGKLYVKKFVEERDLTVFILLDVSESLETGTATLLKKELLIRICATIAYSALKNNDRAGLIIFTDRIEKFIPPRKRRDQLYRIIRETVASDFNSKRTDFKVAVDYLMKVNKERAIVFILSDFQFPSLDEAVKLIARVSKKNDTIGIRIIDPSDFELPPAGFVHFIDPETQEALIIDTSDPNIRERYRRLAFQKNMQIKNALNIKNFELIEISTAEDYVKPLLRFFKLREKRLGRARY